ncbi:MAG: response regulator [Myxococcales bacterium]|nr:response regulator [Myxococcales bacterium]MCB9704302.1 response regulator [Myxococcales bacterium]
MTQRVLIVDDNHELADNLAELLEDEGYEVATAYSGERALEIARDSKFDTVLADIRMPGMNGVELVQNLSRINPSTTYLLMTAYSSDALLGEAMRAGVKAILPKPLDLGALLRRLPLGATNVLILEDDAALASLLAESLERRGYRVRIANGVHQAVAEIKEARPDAVVLDVFLPDGNGAELARDLCTESGIPVVLMTGYDFDGAAGLVQSLPAQSSRFLTKPFQTNALLDALRSLVPNEGERAVGAS